MSKAAIAPEIEKPSILARTFRAFGYRDFRLLWFGAFTSSSGTWLQEAALAWLLLQKTNNPFLLGLNGFLATAPILLFTLLGGVLADRFDRRRILLVSQWAQLIFTGSLAILTFMNVSVPVLVWTALTASFFTGCAQAFGGPAYQSLIPMLVEKKDLPNAIALNSIQFQLARIVGSVISSLPFVIVANQMSAASMSFGLNSLSYLVVIIALSLLSVRHIPKANGNGMRSEFREGFRFVMHNEALRSLTLLAFVSTFFGVQITTFTAVFAKNIFEMGAEGNAILMSITGAGAVIGALIVAGIGNIQHKGWYALFMMICFGLSIMAFTAAPNIIYALPFVFMNGVFMMIVFSLITSLVQLLVDDKMRGRVMSIFMLAFRGGMPLGALITGTLVKYYPLPRIIFAEGLILTLIAVAYLMSKSQVKEK